MSSTGSCEPSVMLACLFNASNCGSRGRSAQIFLYHCNGLMPQNQILAEYQRLTSGTEGWKFPSLKYRTLGFLVFFFRCWIYSSYSFDLRIQNKIHMVPKYESLQRTEKFGSNKIYIFFLNLPVLKRGECPCVPYQSLSAEGILGVFYFRFWVPVQAKAFSICSELLCWLEFLSASVRK